jgi:hypothetical protein
MFRCSGQVANLYKFKHLIIATSVTPRETLHCVQAEFKCQTDICHAKKECKWKLLTETFCGNFHFSVFFLSKSTNFWTSFTPLCIV